MIQFAFQLSHGVRFRFRELDVEHSFTTVNDWSTYRYDSVNVGSSNHAILRSTIRRVGERRKASIVEILGATEVASERQTRLEKSA